MPRLGAGSDDEDDYLGEPDAPRGGQGETTVVALHCGTRGVSIAAVRCNMGIHFKIERKYAVAGLELPQDSEYKPVVGSRSNAAILRRMLRRSQLLSEVLTDVARPYVVVLRPELGRRPTYFQRAKFESKGRDANCIANSLITDFPHATVFDMVRRSTRTAVKYFKGVAKKAADSRRKAQAAAAGDDDSDVDDDDYEEQEQGNGGPAAAGGGYEGDRETELSQLYGEAEEWLKSHWCSSPEAAMQLDDYESDREAQELTFALWMALFPLTQTGGPAALAKSARESGRLFRRPGTVPVSTAAGQAALTRSGVGPEAAAAGRGAAAAAAAAAAGGGGGGGGGGRGDRRAGRAPPPQAGGSGGGGGGSLSVLEARAMSAGYAAFLKALVDAAVVAYTHADPSTMVAAVNAAQAAAEEATAAAAARAASGSGGAPAAPLRGAGLGRRGGSGAAALTGLQVTTLHAGIVAYVAALVNHGVLQHTATADVFAMACVEAVDSAAAAAAAAGNASSRGGGGAAAAAGGSGRAGRRAGGGVPGSPMTPQRRSLYDEYPREGDSAGDAPPEAPAKRYQAEFANDLHDLMMEHGLGVGAAAAGAADGAAAAAAAARAASRGPVSIKLEPGVAAPASPAGRRAALAAAAERRAAAAAVGAAGAPSAGLQLGTPGPRVTLPPQAHEVCDLVSSEKDDE